MATVVKLYKVGAGVGGLTGFALNEGCLEGSEVGEKVGPMVFTKTVPFGLKEGIFVVG